MRRKRESLPTRKKTSAKNLLNGLTEAQLMTVWDMVEAEHNRLTEIDDIINDLFRECYLRLDAKR